MACAAPWASKKFTLFAVKRMLAGIVDADWTDAADGLASVATTAVTGVVGDPWISRLPVASIRPMKPFDDRPVARSERFWASVLAELKFIWIWGGTAVAGTPAAESLRRKVVVTPPLVTAIVSPLVKVGAAGLDVNVKVFPTVIGVVLPVFRFCAGLVGRFAE